MPTTLHGRSATRDTLLDAFDFAQSQVRALVEKYPRDYYPMYTVGGQYGQDRKRWTHWCDGFYPGMMFVFAEATGDGNWLDDAARSAAVRPRGARPRLPLLLDLPARARPRRPRRAHRAGPDSGGPHD